MQKKLLALIFLSIPATSQTAIAADNPPESPWQFSSGAWSDLNTMGKNLQTDYFKVEQWGFLTAKSTLLYSEWYYPSHNDAHGPGIFTLDAHKIGRGDFNGDGSQDALVSWVAFPHTLDKPGVPLSLVLNEDGQLRLSEAIWQGDSPARLMHYHVAVEDFNFDGKDDAALAVMGVIERHPDGTTTNIWDRISVVMSEGEHINDASARVEGQADGGIIPSFEFAHDIASGDINGDGLIDFYQGRHLYVGDGMGGFALRSDLLPADARPGGTYLMSSAIGDLDNDGVDDLVIGHTEGQQSHAPASGWIYLSNGTGGILTGTKHELPAGHYGLTNTKHNHIALADLNSDGRLDILIGQTRAAPYYVSRNVQLLMNHGNGNFVDESAARLSEANRPEANGEGEVLVMDVNSDGHLDIVDASGRTPEDIAVLVNDGTGVFSRMPPELMPRVKNFHVQGMEDWSGDHAEGTTMYIYPIDLEGEGLASYIVQFQRPYTNWPPTQGDIAESTFYVMRASTPYQPADGPKRLSDVDCVFNWAEKMFPDLIPIAGRETGKLQAYHYRYYPGTDTYLALLGDRVLTLTPSVEERIYDQGSIFQFLPEARGAGCGI